MLTTSEVARVYDTIMSIPGMNETVKIDLRISRKNALLLHHVIERGLDTKGDEKNAGLLASVPGANLEELKALASDCLAKAGLVELNQKLLALAGTK